MTIVIGFGFYNLIGSEMMPLADVGQAFAVLEMAPGTNFDDTERAVVALEKMMSKHPKIEKISTEIGTETTLTIPIRTPLVFQPDLAFQPFRPTIKKEHQKRWNHRSLVNVFSSGNAQQLAR